MRYPFIVLLLFMTIGVYGQSHKKKMHRNQFHPGVAVAYLPTWVLDNIDGNTPGTVMIAGLNIHQEIWKESVLKFGLSNAKLFGPRVEDHLGTVIPIRLQKFFVPERKGFSLSAGILINFCPTCQERIDGAFTNEIAYLFNFHAVSINCGIQIIEGSLFDAAAVHLGLGLEAIWRWDKLESVK